MMPSQAVRASRTIISRNLDPPAAVALRVGPLSASCDTNVIPRTAELWLNVRWFTMKVREEMVRRRDEINRGIVLGVGVPADRMPMRIRKGSAGPLVQHVNPAPEGLLACYAHHTVDVGVSRAAIPPGARVNTVMALSILST